MKLTKVPGHFFYQGENGKYYRCLREVSLDFNGNQLSEPIDHWEEVDYADEIAREEYNGRKLGQAILDKIRQIQREDPETWAKIEARADEIRKEREGK